LPAFLFRATTAEPALDRLSHAPDPATGAEQIPKLLQKEQKKIDPQVDFFATEVAVQRNRING
jgi:hypothetical protein